jgi:hypothetical protein
VDQSLQFAPDLAARRRAGFTALSQRQRTIVAGVLWVLAFSVGDGMFFLRAAAKGTAPAMGDRSVFATYLALVIGFALLLVAGRGASSRRRAAALRDEHWLDDAPAVSRATACTGRCHIR